MEPFENTWVLTDIWQASGTSHSKSSMETFTCLNCWLMCTAIYRYIWWKVSWCSVRGSQLSQIQSNISINIKVIQNSSCTYVWPYHNNLNSDSSKTAIRAFLKKLVFTKHPSSTANWTLQLLVKCKWEIQSIWKNTSYISVFLTLLW